MIQHETNEYTIPRGRVYFDHFDATGALTGEVPFGNCPGVSVSISTTKVDHYSSQTGVDQKDASKVVRAERTGKISCDNISLDNIARYYGSESIETITQAAASVPSETRKVRPGRIYQLGATADDPVGARSVSAVSIKGADDGELTEGEDYALDASLGRLQILTGGSVADGEAIKISYTKAARSWKRIRAGAIADIAGALRVIADHAAGTNRDHYMPSVKLTPSGDLPLISDGTDWVSMEFELEILTPESGTAIYCDNRPVA